MNERVTWPFRVRIPDHLAVALWEHADRTGREAFGLKRLTVAEYLYRVKEGLLLHAEEKRHRMGYRENVKLTLLNWYLPEGVALDLFRYSDETGVSKEALITLALDQFLRAHGANRTPVLETAKE